MHSPGQLIAGAFLAGMGVSRARRAARLKREAVQIEQEAVRRHGAARDVLLQQRDRCVQVLLNLGWARFSVVLGRLDWLRQTCAAVKASGTAESPSFCQLMERFEGLEQGGAGYGLMDRNRLPRKTLLSLGAFGWSGLNRVEAGDRLVLAFRRDAEESSAVAWMAHPQSDLEKMRTEAQASGGQPLVSLLVHQTLELSRCAQSDRACALANLSRAEHVERAMMTTTAALTGIWRAAGDFLRHIAALEERLPAMDASAPSAEAVKAALILKGLVDVPLLTPEGALTREFYRPLEAARAYVEGTGGRIAPETALQA